MLLFNYGGIVLEVIENIKNKLEKLKALDSDFDIFGSEYHKYKMNTTLTSKEIDAFEKEYSVKLPLEYRLFLETIGNGGAGPLYGLFELTNNDGNNPCLKKEFIYTYDRPFLMNDVYDEMPGEITNEYHKDILDVMYDEVDRGIIYLSTEGCGMYSVLVVNGKEHGTVWFLDLANDFGALPLMNPTTNEPMRFFDWYELWLDKSLLEVSGEEIFASYMDFIAAS